jgi:glycolate oxidase
VAVAFSESLVAELVDICGEAHVLTSRSARFNRTRVPAPFPVHRWAELIPGVVVLPDSTEQIVEIVKLANRTKTPIVPRAGGTGLADGAVPRRGGIVVDIKRMNRILEIDLVDHVVTVQPGINLQKLNERLVPHGVFYPDDPVSYPCCLVGGRLGTGGWSLLGGRYGHTRDLVTSVQIILPTGKVIRVGDGGGPKIRKSSTALRLKDLFIGHQGTLGICTEATLELAPRPEAELAAYFHYPDFDAAYKAAGAVAQSGLATLALVVLMDEEKVEFLRRDDEAYIPQPPHVRAVVGAVLHGSEVEVRGASQDMLKRIRKSGGRYLGDELSRGDWASRHERYATPMHGRLRNGQVVPMSWHCEDAAIPYSELRQVREKYHAVLEQYMRDYEIFDDWGMFFLSNGGRKPWADYLAEIDVGIWEQQLDEAGWNAFVALKRELAKISIRLGGSITSCHGATREGDAELIPLEVGPESLEVMFDLKRMLDPNNVMNPGKNLFDSAYDATLER